MGEPILRNGSVPIFEHIEDEEATRGTETSKYPEEKKTKVIPQVAASEQGEA